MQIFLRVHLLLCKVLQYFLFLQFFLQYCQLLYSILKLLELFVVIMQDICTDDSNTLQSIAIFWILVILIAILCNIALSIDTINALLGNHAGNLKVDYNSLQYIVLLLICTTYCNPLPYCAQYCNFYCSTVSPYRYFASVIPISAKYCSTISFAILIALLRNLSFSIYFLMIYLNIMRVFC